VYPVKSAAGLDLERTAVHPWGLEHDRRWMVVDADGDTVTARTRRPMLHIVPTPRPDGSLVLDAPGLESLHVPVPHDGEKLSVTLSRVEWGHAAGPAPDEWLSQHLSEPVRLVWLDDPARRSVGASHGGEPGDSLSFADAGPILLTTTASLARLDEWIQATSSDRGEAAPDPLPMVRFRPNVVVDGGNEPFAEDEWKRLRIGDLDLRFAEHCDRCVLPTIDPVTLLSTKEPTRSLALHRQWDHKVHFGVRLVPLRAGQLAVGDEVSFPSN
jgi:uncharacterized protein YcbX